MPRLITAPHTKKLYPRHDPLRMTAVVSLMDYDNACGFIRIEGIDVPFTSADVLGGGIVRPGQTVTFLMADDRAAFVCNIHDDESIAALIDHQREPAYA